jgi:hypothetical protein
MMPNKPKLKIYPSIFREDKNRLIKKLEKALDQLKNDKIDYI